MDTGWTWRVTEGPARYATQLGFDHDDIGVRVSKIKILLLTNNDSDNVGDQIIEASVISLIKGAMLNLGVPADGYSISSRAAGIISKKYMDTRDPALLTNARKAISGSDVLVFGGAPLFNYSYQNFYLKTITTLELANEYGVPVIFSSIGVEKYSEKSAKSQQLKKALELPVVRQITTRDDIDSVRKYTESSGIPVAHVPDPAVFADLVFRKGGGGSPSPSSAPQDLSTNPAIDRNRAGRLLSSARRTVGSRLKAAAVRGRSALPARLSGHSSTVQADGGAPAASSAPAPGPKKPSGRRIGLVVTRAGIFKDNRIDFSEEDQQNFWLDVISRLKARGDDYKLFTTGHFADEVFLDNLVRTRGVPAKKVSFTINSPEELIAQLSACDGVIAYRLHANITCFAYSIPSVGLSWNFKVPYFYDSVGYGHRAIAPENWNASHVLAQLDLAMRDGVEKDHDDLMGVYRTLFEGLRDVVSSTVEEQPFTYEELRTSLPRYSGTSHSQYQAKVRRKMRRTYETFKKKDLALADARDALKELESKAG